MSVLQNPIEAYNTRDLNSCFFFEHLFGGTKWFYCCHLFLNFWQETFSTRIPRVKYKIFLISKNLFSDE